jgi:hypothetical protein
MSRTRPPEAESVSMSAVRRFFDSLVGRKAPSEQTDPDRRSGSDRRSGQDRRERLGAPPIGEERRSGSERRSGTDRRKG